jgi:fucose permease
MREPRHTLYLVSCAAMFVFGIVLALPGTVLALPEVADRLHLTLASRGTLISALFLGLLSGSFLSGPLVDRVGQRRMLGASALLVATCLPLFAAAPGYVLAAASLAAIGLASAGVNTASNALSSDLFPEERGRRMNGLAVAVGLGGLSLPAATALASGVLTWSWIVTGGAILAAAVAAIALVVRGPAEHLHSSEARGVAQVARQRGLMWIAALVALAAGTEASMAGFTSTYLSARGFTATAATWALSAHWVGLIVGRVVLAGHVDRAKARAVVAAAAAGASGILALVTFHQPAILAAMPFVVGVAIGTIMPTSLALAGERYPRGAGTLFGLLLTSAQAGAMALPSIIGVVSEWNGVRAGMAVLVVNNVLVAAVCVRATRGNEREGHKAQGSTFLRISALGISPPQRSRRSRRESGDR